MKKKKRKQGDKRKKSFREEGKNQGYCSTAENKGKILKRE